MPSFLKICYIYGASLAAKIPKWYTSLRFSKYIRATAVDEGSKLTAGPLVSGFPSNIFVY